MKKKILFQGRIATTLTSFLLLVLLFSCSKSETDDLSPAATQNSNSLSADMSKFNNTKQNDLGATNLQFEGLINVSHGECFGMCPDYSISITREGVVTYKGNKNVGVLGTVTYNINPEVAQNLADFMERNGFFSFQDHYNLIPDGQRNETSLFLNGRMKDVVDYGVGIPIQLKEMRDLIEKTVDVKKFIEGTADPSTSLNK